MYVSMPYSMRQFNNLPRSDSSAAETMVHGVSIDNTPKEVNTKDTKAEQVNTSV